MLIIDVIISGEMSDIRRRRVYSRSPGYPELIRSKLSDSRVFFTERVGVRRLNLIQCRMSKLFNENIMNEITN